MKPGQLPAQEPDGLFKTPLSRFIDMKHPLVQLADKINWSYLEGQGNRASKALDECFEEFIAPSGLFEFSAV